MSWTLTKDKKWDSLLQEFDWVAAMQGVPQDSRHHAEGDVAVHTKMVLDALSTLPAYTALLQEQKELLWAAALLHDVEKRSTTVLEDDGSITSRGHAKKGEFTTRQILYRDVPTPFEIREHIAALVRYHGLPLWIAEKKDPQKAIIEASVRLDTKQLALLARADVLGRICGDQKDLLDRVDFFEAYCEEQECWGNPRVFSSCLAQFHYFQNENASPQYEPFDDYKTEVIMLSGLPGMGKDTFIRKNYAGYSVVSLDDIRRKHKLKPDDAAATGWAVQQAKEQAKVYLRKGQPFVWNATNVTRQMRSQWIDLFATYKAKTKLIYIEVPYKEWLHQNKSRENVVPNAVLMRLLNKLEVPMVYEAHAVEYFVK